MLTKSVRCEHSAESLRIGNNSERMASGLFVIGNPLSDAIHRKPPGNLSPPGISHAVWRSVRNIIELLLDQLPLGMGVPGKHPQVPVPANQRYLWRV